MLVAGGSAVWTFRESTADLTIFTIGAIPKPIHCIRSCAAFIGQDFVQPIEDNFSVAFSNGHFGKFFQGLLSQFLLSCSTPC